jgi:hypothetical protein
MMGKPIGFSIGRMSIVLEYRYAHLELGGKRKHCILLPKMNGKQLDVLRRKLISLGFRIERKNIFSAKKGTVRIWLDPSGLCWSSVDPTDYVIPSIPELLGCEKEKIRREEFNQLYFNIIKNKDNYLVRFKTRLEHGYTWKLLRKIGISGFSPDECTVIKWLLGFARGNITALCSYPIEDSSILRIGRRNYYVVELDVERFVSEISDFTTHKRRQCFLFQECTVTLRSLNVSSMNKSNPELGEWCYYTF